MTRALVLVDLQNDFLPGGALAVPNGDDVIAVARKLVDKFDLIVATQDWHPPDHGSFAANHPGKNVGDLIKLGGLDQILWPTHCVQDTPGAAFAAGLPAAAWQHVIRKGTDPSIDSYSGFFDNDQRQSTGLEAFLLNRQVTDVYLAGLATDYCVKSSALDARRLEFKTFVVRDGCRGANLEPGDDQRALSEMEAAGVRLVSSDEI